MKLTTITKIGAFPIFWNSTKKSKHSVLSSQRKKNFSCCAPHNGAHRNFYTHTFVLHHTACSKKFGSNFLFFSIYWSNSICHFFLLWKFFFFIKKNKKIRKMKNNVFHSGKKWKTKWTYILCRTVTTVRCSLVWMLFPVICMFVRTENWVLRNFFEFGESANFGAIKVENTFTRNNRNKCVRRMVWRVKRI